MEIYFLYPIFSKHLEGKTGMTKSKSLLAKLRVRVKSQKPRNDFYVIKISLAKL